MATERFWVRVVDQFGTSSRAPISITVHGADEAPAIGGALAGEVFEDGAKVAAGQLTASGVGPDHSWSVLDAFGTPGGFAAGGHGFLSLDSLTGQWTYSLDNFAPQVQALAQGEQATDSFTLALYDAGLLVATETVTVAVTGSNDIPGISGVTAAGVIEDALTSTSGQLFGVDIDHDAAFSWSIGPGPTGYSSDYLVTADWLRITQNGTLVFHDPFDAGGPPPSAPSFVVSGNPAFYLTSGVFGEANGRLIFDGSVANATTGMGYDPLRVQQNALLETGTSSSLSNGIKIDDDFVVEAAFDLTVPDAGEGYAIGLQDRLSASQAGDDLALLNVFGNGAGGLRVQLADASIVTDSSIVLESLDFDVPAGASQIVLRLAHDNEQPGSVRGAFDVLDGAGAVILSHEFGATAHIFGSDTPDYPGDDEVFTRVQITAFGDDVNGNTLAGQYGTLSIDSLGEWTYTLDNDADHVQRLEQGQQFTERFWVRVVDQYGASSRVPIDIIVSGSNDAPTLAPIGPLSVEERAELSFFAAASDIDDPVHALIFSLVDAPEGASIDAARGLFTWTPTETQDGEHSFTVRVTDASGAFGEELVAVTVLEDARLDAGLRANDGQADVFRLVRAGEMVQGYLDGSLVFERPAAALAATGLAVAGSDDADTLVVDFSAGSPLPDAGLSYLGGEGFDALSLLGGTFDSVVYTAFDSHSGSVSLDGALISYAGLDPIDDTLAARERRFVFGDGSDSITLAIGAAGSTLSGTSTETVTFTNDTGTVVIEAGGGDDAIVVEDAGGTAAFELFINGGEGDNAGRVNGTAGDDVIVATQLDEGSVRFEVNGAARVLAGLSHVTLDGLAGDDVIDLSGVLLPAVVHGGDGDDAIIGGAGDDRLFGDAGDDLLSGGPGADLLDGGEDADAALLERIAPIAYRDFGSKGVNLDRGEYIAVPHDPVYEVAEGTIQFWFKADDARKEQALLAKDAKGLGAGELLIWLDEGDLRVKLESSSAKHIIKADNVVRAGTWYQLTFTFGSQGMKLYLDGALVAQNAYTGGLVGNTRHAVIGGSNAGDHPGGGLKVSDTFDGRIDEVALFGTALTPEQIAQTLEKGALAVVAPSDVDDVLVGIEEVRHVDAPARPVAQTMLADSALVSIATYIGLQGRVELGLFSDPAPLAGRAPAAAQAPGLSPSVFERAGEPAEWIRVTADPARAVQPVAAGEVKTDWTWPAAASGSLPPFSGKAASHPNVVDFKLPGRTRR
jgi:VCBS repeat-containing protein